MGQIDMAWRGYQNGHPPKGNGLIPSFSKEGVELVQDIAETKDTSLVYWP